MNNEVVAIRAINIAKELGFNKKDISERTGLSTTIMSRISKVKRQTSREEVELIANSVGLDLDILYNKDCSNFEKYNWLLSQKNGKFTVAKRWSDLLFPIINRDYERLPKKKYCQVMNYSFATKLKVLLGSEYKYYEIYTKSNADNETDEDYGGGSCFADYPCALIEHKTRNGFAISMGYWFPEGILFRNSIEPSKCCIVQAICVSYDKDTVQDGNKVCSEVINYCKKTNVEFQFDKLKNNTTNAMKIRMPYNSKFELYAPSLYSSYICYNLIMVNMEDQDSNDFDELDKKFLDMFALYKGVIENIFNEYYAESLIEEPDDHSMEREIDLQCASSNKTKKQEKPLYEHCIKCGTKFPEQAMYCPKCGTKRDYY